MEHANPDLTTPAAWDHFIHQSPAVALERARAADDGSTSDETTAMLKYAIGKSLFELGHASDAAKAMKPAAKLVVSGSVADVEIRRAVLMTAAMVLAEIGAIDDALEHLRTLEHECDGVTLGRVHLQQAIVLFHAGRTNDALVALEESDRLFSVDGGDLDRLRVYINRGVVLLQRGDFDAGESDFLAGAELARSLGIAVHEGQCFANVATLYGRSRRLVDSLRAFDRASELFREAGQPARTTTWMEIDRAEVMMHSGLVADAVDAAHRALSIARPSGNAAMVGDAMMMCARTELAAGRLRDAIRTANDAAEFLDRTGRHDMVTHAEGVMTLAALRRANVAETTAAYERSSELMTRLASHGWHDQVDELAVDRIRTAWRTDTFQAVVDDVSSLRLHAFRPRRDRALVGWFAEAVARRLDDDDLGAADACRRGLDLLDDIVAEATSLEARSAAIRLGADLSQLLIETALQRGDADTVFATAEGTRARALHDELHDVYRHRPLTEDGASLLERAVTGRLGDLSLVEWVVARGRVSAVIVDRDGTRLVDVGDEHDVMRARDRVVVALDMAAEEPDAPSARAERAAQALDELLVAPLDLGDGEGVVVVPVGMLHEVPWAGLPSLAGRSVTLAPSAQLWLEADRRANGSLDRIGLISGPDIEAAALERDAITTQYESPAIAEGTGATAGSARSMFGGYDLVHVAAHGRFRSDRPLLSTLRLEGGEATMYDAVPDRIGARLIVLSSCEGGAQGAADGSEVLGLAAVMLARGAASVVAPLTVVRDLECAEFVAEFHAEFAKGEPVADALANVRQRWLSDDDLSRWAVASSFICFGSGRTQLAR